MKPEGYDGEQVAREAHRHHQYRVQLGVDCHYVGEELRNLVPEDRPSDRLSGPKPEWKEIKPERTQKGRPGQDQVEVMTRVILTYSNHDFL